MRPSFLLVAAAGVYATSGEEGCKTQYTTIAVSYATYCPLPTASTIAYSTHVFTQPRTTISNVPTTTDAPAGSGRESPATLETEEAPTGTSNAVSEQSGAGTTPMQSASASGTAKRGLALVLVVGFNLVLFL